MGVTNYLLTGMILQVDALRSHPNTPFGTQPNKPLTPPTRWMAGFLDDTNPKVVGKPHKIEGMDTKPIGIHGTGIYLFICLHF